MVDQSQDAESTSGAVYITSMDQLRKLHHDDVKKNDIYLIAPHLIEVEPNYNARDLSNYEDHIESLKRQWISGPSLIPPLIIAIKNGKVFVRDGHCRLEAANRAIAEGCPIPRLTCQVFRGTEAEQDALILKTQQGAKLDHVEQAIVYARMAARGALNKEIAQILDVSEQQVKNMLQIHALSDRLKKYITTGVIRYYALLEMLRAEGGNEEKVSEYIEEIIAQSKQQPSTEGGEDGKVAAKRKATVTAGALNKAKGGIARFTPAIKKHTQSFLTSLINRIDLPGDGEEAKSITVVLTPDDLQLLISLRSVAVISQDNENPTDSNQLPIDLDPDDHPHSHLIVDESPDAKSDIAKDPVAADPIVLRDEFSQLNPDDANEDPREEFFS